MDSFYVILPSNAPVVGNKTSNFTVRLPNILDLDSNWTVALSSIIYPVSFISAGIEEDQYINIHYKNGDILEIKIPAVTYTSIETMETSINDALMTAIYEKFHTKSRSKRQTGQKTPQESLEETKSQITEKQKLLDTTRTLHDSAKKERGEAHIQNVKINKTIEEIKAEIDNAKEQLKEAKQIADKIIKAQKEAEANTLIEMLQNRLNETKKEKAEIVKKWQQAKSEQESNKDLMEKIILEITNLKNLQQKISEEILQSRPIMPLKSSEDQTDTRPVAPLLKSYFQRLEHWMVE